MKKTFSMFDDTEVNKANVSMLYDFFDGYQAMINCVEW